MPIQFKPGDAVKLMLQFMKENGLNKPLKCLQEESKSLEQRIKAATMWKYSLSLKLAAKRKYSSLKEILF